MVYRTSFLSFFGSLLYALVPAIVAGVVLYFLGNSARVFMQIASGLMFLFSLYLCLQTIYVYLQKLYIDDYGIAVISPLIKHGIRWQDVTSAELFERENLLSRTDHLVIIKCAGNILLFNTSTLSPRGEDEVLKTVGGKTNLVTRRHKPTI